MGTANETGFGLFSPFAVDVCPGLVQPASSHLSLLPTSSQLLEI